MGFGTLWDDSAKRHVTLVRQGRVRCARICMNVRMYTACMKASALSAPLQVMRPLG